MACLQYFRQNLIHVRQELFLLTVPGEMHPEIGRSGSRSLQGFLNGLVYFFKWANNNAWIVGCDKMRVQLLRKDMGSAAKAMRNAGIGGTVKNLGGTKRRSVRRQGK